MKPRLKTSVEATGVEPGAALIGGKKNNSMKNLLLILALTGTVRAQVQFFDATTPHTNNVTTHAWISIPGVCTNAPYVVTNYISVTYGDAWPAPAITKLNSDLNYLTNQFTQLARLPNQINTNLSVQMLGVSNGLADAVLKLGALTNNLSDLQTGLAWASNTLTSFPGQNLQAGTVSSNALDAATLAWLGSLGGGGGGMSLLDGAGLLAVDPTNRWLLDASGLAELSWTENGIAIGSSASGAGNLSFYSPSDGQQRFQFSTQNGWFILSDTLGNNPLFLLYDQYQNRVGGFCSQSGYFDVYAPSGGINAIDSANSLVPVTASIGYFGVGYNFSLSDDGSGAAIQVSPNNNDGSAGSISLHAGSQPSLPQPGQIYFDAADSHFYGFDGTEWKKLDN